MAYQVEHQTEDSRLGQVVELVGVAASLIPGIISGFRKKAPELSQEDISAISVLPPEYVPLAVAEVLKASDKKAAASKAITKYGIMAAKKAAMMAARSTGAPKPKGTNWLLIGGIGGGVLLLLVGMVLVMKKRGK